jgi:hypothetical protein
MNVSVFNVQVFEEARLDENLKDLFLVHGFELRQTEALSFPVQPQRQYGSPGLGNFFHGKFDAFRNISFFGRQVLETREEFRNINFLRAAIVTDLTCGAVPDARVSANWAFSLLKAFQ